MKPFSKGRLIAVAVLVVALALVLSVASLIICAIFSLSEDNAVLVSLGVFAAVSLIAFIYMVVGTPKEEKVMKAIGFAGMTFDIMIVPATALLRLLTGE